MLPAAGSALVAGNLLENAMEPTLQTLNVRVLRPFFYNGAPLTKDETLVLPRVFALEMQAAKKAEIVAEAKPAAGEASLQAQRSRGRKTYAENAP